MHRWSRRSQIAGSGMTCHFFPERERRAGTYALAARPAEVRHQDLQSSLASSDFAETRSRSSATSSLRCSAPRGSRVSVVVADDERRASETTTVSGRRMDYAAPRRDLRSPTLLEEVTSRTRGRLHRPDLATCRAMSPRRDERGCRRLHAAAQTQARTSRRHVRSPKSAQEASLIAPETLGAGSFRPDALSALPRRRRWAAPSPLAVSSVTTTCSMSVSLGRSYIVSSSSARGSSAARGRRCRA